MKKRSVNIAGHQTSITLESPFWKALQDLARDEKLSLNQLITEIDKKNEGNLSSAIRVYILKKLQEKLSSP